MAGYQGPRQEDVPQDGGDEALKVGRLHLQTHTTVTVWPHTASTTMCSCALTEASRPSPTTEKWPTWYGQKAEENSRVLVRGEAASSTPAQHNQILRASLGSSDLPKTKMKRVFKDTTQKTCS